MASANSPNPRGAARDSLGIQQRVSVLARKARRTSAAAWLCLILSGLVLATGVLGVIGSLDRTASPEVYPDEVRARAERVNALRAQGESMALAAVGLVVLGFSWLANRTAKKWAKAATELEAQSEPENRRLLTFALSSREPWVLFLRGFGEEGRSIETLVAMPLSSKRVAEATRWMEAAIVAEMAGRDKKVFCVTNPRDALLLPGALRLAVPEMCWMTEVENLTVAARIVVIYVSALSSGLTVELDLLRRGELARKAIVVVSRRIERAAVALVAGFPNVIRGPSSNRALRSPLFGPLGGRAFRRNFRAAVDAILATESTVS